MKPPWIEFNPMSPNLPPERRYVLVLVAEQPDKGMPPGVAVGYLRRFSGGNNFFVIPGSGGRPTHYADCLGDDFETPEIAMSDGGQFKMKQDQP